ncbi:SRPBCC family protein [Halomicronema sp. CCY15110]|uniref:SRPBCC family protein n=1 Tax=Halomicronema sp. CCY15110 TaxID=2767773 RepID=UPI001950134C|nr:SRPBCC family protein [Halomicronema sp. CCY15110]
MSLTSALDQLTLDLASDQQQALQAGEVVMLGSEGTYTVVSLVPAPSSVVWEVLTDYERFPDFLPSVVASRILEKRDNRVLVERKDSRKVGILPIRVKIVTENIEYPQDRIEYRMVDGTLDEMNGTWELTPVQSADGGEAILLTQKIVAKASMGPLQPYFYEVFESGLQEMTANLRQEMVQQQTALVS